MATIRVLEQWRGIHSDGMLIEAGEYPHDDPALFQAVPYLIESGLAKWVGAPPAQIETETETIDFESMTLDEIDEWMVAEGIEKPVGWSSLKKDARIVHLENILLERE